MSRCLDWPCCGHEIGCCPDFDNAGNQLNMVCVCGAKLPIDSRSSCCASCLRDTEDHDGSDYEYDDEYDADIDAERIRERQELEDFDDYDDGDY